MHEVKLSGGPLDGQVFNSPRPLFEVQIKFEPEDETATVDINDLEVHVYRDVDADDETNILRWCKNPGDPFSMFG